jgi:hypothetical protein
VVVDVVGIRVIPRTAKISYMEDRMRMKSGLVTAMCRLKYGKD